MNAYAKEDRIAVLKAAGFIDLVDRYAQPEPCTYVFDGQWGYLDHALASPSLADQASGVSLWHINADEVNLLDYNDVVRTTGEASFEAKPSTTELYAPDAFRASDHDPVVVALDISPTATVKAACRNGGWQSVYRDDNTVFKNQGDCIQYVNTGK